MFSLLNPFLLLIAVTQCPMATSEIIMAWTKSPSAIVPIAYLAGASIIFYFAFNVSPPLRLLCLPFLCLFASWSVATMQNFTWPEGLGNLWGLSILIWIPHVLSVFFIETDTRMVTTSFDGMSITTPKKWDMMAAYKLLFNTRLINTLQQAPGMKRARRPMTMLEFLVTRLSKLFVYWLLHTQIEPLLYPKFFLPFSAEDFAPSRQVYFRRLLSFSQTAGPPVTLRETLLRATVVLHWIFSAVYEIDSAHTFLSILFVAVLRVDKPSEWPPLFGSLLQAYNLRRFWAHFWHRIAYRPYTNVGKLVSRQILSLKPRSGADNAVVAFTVFFVSGLVHSLISWCAGDKHFYMLDTLFFICNFAAGAVEVFVSKHASVLKTIDQYHWLQNPKRQATLMVCSKAAGLVWVFGFFFWILPKWQYPRVYHQLQYLTNLNRLRTALFGGER
ncbi:hypothetical protein L228DRAFT_235525 [Xylona heveae TC161]|uniref:Wax synthase domain-containing protein n=1 Tax=Xylona heveae (strain CBS 132557 / TC161) TaxID=1328760 RepID=A0A165JNK9_XYLHT|nr:hypothetical protein L228DRAFT_235525 [Xylona heveae TC161]KZF26455.1 hypothetical protein L228DRAFT_235525 [Xylona heveae TC161]